MNSLTSTPNQTENTVTIVVTDVIGDTLCIACEDGQKVYEQVAVALRKGKSVVLSFKNGEDLTPAFLNLAIGQLYHWFPEEQIEASLRVIDIQPDDADMMEDVIRDTKKYLEDPQRFTYATLEVLGADYL
ncbi:STAS-like domain-containing protein [Iningainema tapete]|uniref:STAS-like domain-containing protein n=1 Tax=Iningainema tapete BLCC-T55 TaxID=2748662 RepID=A0A8J6XI09_9CYAN|nr:STAS-like domain-containing protein [Iningainema tapete]MBD2776319.1 STAS-like domain-containing protein [Iningainema tapete BLCC-T55]